MNDFIAVYPPTANHIKMSSFLRLGCSRHWLQTILARKYTADQHNLSKNARSTARFCDEC